MTDLIATYLFIGFIVSALGTILLNILGKPISGMGFVIDAVLWPLTIYMMIVTFWKGGFNASG